MERQLLYLLDWDVGVSEQDLFDNLEPFLAPIRLQMELQYEEEELSSQRQWYSESTAFDANLGKSLPRPVREDSLPRQPRRRPQAVGVYDSPRSINDEDIAGGRYPHPNISTLSLPAASHKRRPSPYRTADSRSISPPSVRDLPPLSRSGTANAYGAHSSSSSRSSSLAPSNSSRSSSLAPTTRSTGTPGSFSSNIDDNILVVDGSCSPGATQTTSYGKAMAAVRPSMKGHQISFQGDSQQPSKKVKTNCSTPGAVGSVMARFFNTATSGYGRSSRSAVALQHAA